MPGPQAEDLTGQRFGEWSVLNRIDRVPNTKGTVKWLCRCSCGDEYPVGAQELKRGGSRSCKPCALRRTADAKKGKPFTGTRFNETEGFVKVVPEARRCVECSTPLAPSSMKRTVRCRSCAARIREVNRVVVKSPKPGVERAERTKVIPRATLPDTDLKTCLVCLRKFRGPTSYCKEACEHRATRV